MKNKTRTYDLEERTAKFAERIIELCKKTPKNVVTNPIINQLVKAGTSIGANYCEANGASSKADFRNKIHISLKESKETKYWLRMLSKACEELKEECLDLWNETQELTLIFSKIASSSK